MAEVVYCNIRDGHFKVWGYDSFTEEHEGERGKEVRFISYWGRIGLMMHRLQKKEKIFLNFHDAFDFLRGKLKEKRGKGYFPVPNHLYFDAIMDDSYSKLGELLEKYQAKAA